jgi:hypothetical protein
MLFEIKNSKEYNLGPHSGRRCPGVEQGPIHPNIVILRNGPSKAVQNIIGVVWL